MSQFFIVNVWEDHAGCSNAFAVSSEDLAMEKMAELRDANRWDTIEIRGPFTIDDGKDIVGNHDMILHTDDSPKQQARALRDGEGSLLDFELQRNAHRHSQSFHNLQSIRLEVHW